MKVTDPDEKVMRLTNFVEGLMPGRWSMLRPMTLQEAKATTVLWLKIEEASAKVRTGGPKDDEQDYALPIWAGVVPLTLTVQPPVEDPRNLPGLAAPDHVRQFRIG